MKAPSPWHMKCNKCEVKLKANKFNWLLVLTAFFFGALLGVASAVVLIKSENVFNGVALFIIGAVLFEFIAFKLLPNLGVVLEIKNT